LTLQQAKDFSSPGGVGLRMPIMEESRLTTCHSAASNRGSEATEVVVRCNDGLDGGKVTRKLMHVYSSPGAFGMSLQQPSDGTTLQPVALDLVAIVGGECKPAAV
jgi:hypothetical protein